MSLPHVITPPAGFFAPNWAPTTIADVEPVATLADVIDPITGEIYLLEQVDPIDAAIAEQFRLELGTGAAITNQGQLYRAITKVTDSTPQELVAETRRILEPFIERNEIRLLTLSAEAPPLGASADTGAVLVEYANLRSNTTQRFPRGGSA